MRARNCPPIMSARYAALVLTSSRKKPNKETPVGDGFSVPREAERLSYKTIRSISKNLYNITI